MPPRLTDRARVGNAVPLLAMGESHHIAHPFSLALVFVDVSEGGRDWTVTSDRRTEGSGWTADGWPQTAIGEWYRESAR